MDTKKYLYFFLMFLFLFAYRFFVDNDVYFLLKHGEYVWLHGIPYTEPFSIHTGMDFVMQQWLFAALLWKLYSHANFLGVHLLVLVMQFVLILVAFKIGKQLSKNFYGGVWIGLLTSGWLTWFASPRPWLFSMLFLMCELWILETFVEKKSRRVLFFLPLLSLLAINIHASLWPMLFVFLLPYYAEAIAFHKKFSLYFPTQEIPLRPLILSTALMFFAAFLNPYGLDAMLYILKGYHSFHFIGEMRPLTFDPPNGIFGLLFLAASLVLYAKTKFPLRYVLLSAGTACMALSAVRHLFLFLSTLILPLSTRLRNADPEKFFSAPASSKASKKQRPILTFFFMDAVFLALFIYLLNALLALYFDVTTSTGEIPFILPLPVIALFLLLFHLPLFLLHRQMPSTFFPRAGKFLKIAAYVFLLANIILRSAPNLAEVNQDTNEKKPAMDCIAADATDFSTVRLWANYTNGAYPIFRGFHVYIDPRAEIYTFALNHKKDVLEEYLAMDEGIIDYRDVLKENDINYVLAERFDDPLFVYLERDPNYKKIYEDEKFKVFKRTSSQ